MNKVTRLGVLSLITVILLFTIREKLYFDPVSYTAHFADQRKYFGVPNFFDVITNLGFLWIGIHGLRRVQQTPSNLKPLVLIFLGSLIGTAFGSAYFHWETSPARLFWDQLPMSIGFGSFVGMIIADRVDLRIGKWTGFLLCFIGPISVWNIYYGTGATSPYLAIQFGSLILSALLLAVEKSGSLKRTPIFLGIGIYVLAKFFEHYDSQIFDTLGFMSGHSLKHIAAAIALVSIFQGIRVQKP